MPSARYGDTVEQTTCTISRLIRADVIIPASPYIERDAICPNHWRESSAKCAHSLFNCISVTDDIKINEQNKSIGKGPLYLQTEFEAISLFLQKVMAGLYPVGYRTLDINSIFTCIYMYMYIVFKFKKSCDQHLRVYCKLTLFILN